jgi:dimeric dUTPase (all-alpha-NTP-PPase superfamily)
MENQKLSPISLRAVGEMSIGFDLLIDFQDELQRKAYNRDLGSLVEEERMASIRDNALALLDEVHEALSETGWKPWASSNHIDKEAFTGELVDILHFFSNLCVLAGVNGTDLANGYAAKRAKNLQRQQEGYDGVSEKCPYCKRDFTESRCIPYSQVEDGWCQEWM